MDEGVKKVLINEMNLTEEEIKLVEKLYAEQYEERLREKYRAFDFFQVFGIISEFSDAAEKMIKQHREEVEKAKKEEEARAEAERLRLEELERQKAEEAARLAQEEEDEEDVDEEDDECDDDYDFDEDFDDWLEDDEESFFDRLECVSYNSFFLKQDLSKCFAIRKMINKLDKLDSIKYCNVVDFMDEACAAITFTFVFEHNSERYTLPEGWEEAFTVKGAYKLSTTHELDKDEREVVKDALKCLFDVDFDITTRTKGGVVLSANII